MYKWVAYKACTRANQHIKMSIDNVLRQQQQHQQHRKWALLNKSVRDLQ